MNKNQERILTLLSKLSDDQYYKIEPATNEQIEIFRTKATDKQIGQDVIDQLVDLYQVANNSITTS